MLFIYLGKFLIQNASIIEDRISESLAQLAWKRLINVSKQRKIKEQKDRRAEESEQTRSRSAVALSLYLLFHTKGRRE